MAIIEKRGPYQFRVKIRIKGIPELSETFITRKEAEQWAEEAERKIYERTFVDMLHLKDKLLFDLLDYCQKTQCPAKRAQSKKRALSNGSRHPQYPAKSCLNATPRCFASIVMSVLKQCLVEP